MNREFFEQNTVAVAEQMIGCLLMRKIRGETVLVRITETEAYRGQDDPASHAYPGITGRNRVMFGAPGRLYVYLSYGIHSCMNVVTEPEGIPGAVLLRAAVPVEGLPLIRSFRPGIPDKHLLNGPGKLTKGLSISLDFNGYDLFSIESAVLLLPKKRQLPIKRTERIGISKGKEKLWRFVAETT
ncbi:DNA-3-methyladenine glycosylase [Ferviditalea candida]|uniref:Putative 3-methyladenine DNA glycosylase n=1 Tax=Ferviditalea candida TaxID=3108399 RepID=A0ABU5ZCP3_9BACL|nr:DNA-3-methyladenine glycosylase [Paenibacillaceae bacterium T2]